VGGALICPVAPYEGIMYNPRSGSGNFRRLGDLKLFSRVLLFGPLLSPGTSHAGSCDFPDSPPQFSRAPRSARELLIHNLTIHESCDLSAKHLGCALFYDDCATYKTFSISTRLDLARCHWFVRHPFPCEKKWLHPTATATATVTDLLVPYSLPQLQQCADYSSR
jgi:hypothetical protein